MLPYRSGRDAPDGLACRHFLKAENAAFRAHDCFRCNLGFFARSHLTADHSIVANGNSARESGLSSDDDVISNIAVVSDMYQVVELGSSTNPGCAQGRAINAAICSDLDVVLNVNSADLWKLFVAAVSQCETEAIGANYAAGVKNYASADLNSLIESDMGMDCGFFTDGHACPDVHARADITVAPNLSILFDYNIRADAAAVRNPRSFGYNGAGVNGWRRLASGIQESERSRKGAPRIRHANHRPISRSTKGSSCEEASSLRPFG